MPTTPEASALFREHGVLHAPGKASNAGGVSVSGLEQSQNAMHISWEREEIDRRLQQIMRSIHTRCVESCTMTGSRVDYINGSNLSGFKKVAEAMFAFGAV